MYYIMRKSYYVMHKLLRYAKNVSRYAAIITLCVVITLCGVTNAHGANVIQFCQQSPHNLRCVYSQSFPFSIPVITTKVSIHMHVYAAIMKLHHWVEVQDRNALLLMQLFCLSKPANVRNACIRKTNHVTTSLSRVFLPTRENDENKAKEIAAD